MKRIVRSAVFFLLTGLFACLAGLTPVPAEAEGSISFTPQNPRVGEYMDFSVTPDREGALSFLYSVSLNGNPVFTGKEGTEHALVSFRPRAEGAYTLTVVVSYGKKDQEILETAFTVSGSLPRQEGAEVVYSQKDGWWHDKIYSAAHHRSVEKAGCALFALSHALQRMGYVEDAVMPDALAVAYSSCYIEGRGTYNERLLNLAGEVYGFETLHDVIESEAEIAACLKRGDYFSFDIVNGHIALAHGISEDGTRVHITDSASGVTFERMKNGKVWYQTEDGSFVQAETAADLPGNRWFFETQEYGGMEYWLDLSYCARRGMRLFRPHWLHMTTEEGSVPVALSQSGAQLCQVERGGELQTVETRLLQWESLGLDGRTVALVTRKKGATLTDADGKRVPGLRSAPAGTLLTVLEADGKRLYVPWRGKYGYVSRSDVELIPVTDEEVRRGIVSLNGKTAGSVQISIRSEATARSAALTKWKVGTEVAVLGKQDDFYQIEGCGLRGWIQEKYLTTEENTHGQEINEGE